MITFADNLERLVDLTALYEQGKFSESIEQCERTLREHAGILPYWRIKIYCILVGANEDWEKAEVQEYPKQQHKTKDTSKLTQSPQKWRQSGESVYWTQMAMVGEEEGLPPWMKDLRECLDDLYTYQAEDAPSWFQAKEKLDCRVREMVRLDGLRRERPTPSSTGEEDEYSGVDGQATAQSDGTNDEPAKEVAGVQ